MDKPQVVQRLNQIASYLELAAASPFEVLAFRNAAASLHDWDGDLAAAVDAGTLRQLDAVGKGIAGIITEFVRDGSARKYDELSRAYPPGVLELFEVSGLGVKKVKLLYRELGIDSLDSLERAAHSGAIGALPGFGPKGIARIVRSIEWLRQRAASAGERPG